MKPFSADQPCALTCALLYFAFGFEGGLSGILAMIAGLLFLAAHLTERRKAPPSLPGGRRADDAIIR